MFQAHADHFDLVSRRMGFIPLPLGSLVSNEVPFAVTVEVPIANKKNSGLPSRTPDLQQFSLIVLNYFLQNLFFV